MDKKGEKKDPKAAAGKPLPEKMPSQQRNNKSPLRKKKKRRKQPKIED